ncbi:MAG: hypothetical protein K8R87_07725 [Verrucomicrobia bacterium]|nr:hypothetical protein [Verrucomicrobiota bacterium]
MKFNPSSFGIALLSAITLASCDFTGGSSGGTHLKNPTVDQMAEMEKQWGVPPKPDRSRQLRPAGTDNATPATSSAPAQINSPAPVPLPQTEPVVPPVFEPPPSITTDQLQLLKK